MEEQRGLRITVNDAAETKIVGGEPAQKTAADRPEETKTAVKETAATGKGGK